MKEIGYYRLKSVRTASPSGVNNTLNHFDIEKIKIILSEADFSAATTDTEYAIRARTLKIR